MEYTVDYFIDKFEKIPEKKWATGDWCVSDTFCSNGFCGMNVDNYVKGTPEAIAFNNLINLLKITFAATNHNTSYSFFWDNSVSINDGHAAEYQQPTPKQRILAALHDIKKLQEPKLPEPKTIIKYVSVPTSIKKEIVLN